MKTYLASWAVVASLFLSINVSATVHYVDLNSTNPVVPYTNWLTAATNIQDAISFAGSGDTIMVTNGVYQTGGGSSRVSLGTGRTLLSVNGPAFTTIKGYQVPGTTNGPASVRCAYLYSGATLSGFTLTNGSAAGNAGGVYCESTSATISNCVIVGNAAAGGGGAVYQGTLINCTLANNVLLGGGWGGAAYYSILINCRLTGNLSSYRGGGAAFSYLTNCVLAGNRAGSFGGATDSSTLVNCTVTGNTAHEAGGGSAGDTLFNCIVYDNNIELPNTALSNYIAVVTVTNCCTSPLPFYGTGNITNPPFFANPAGGDYHLHPASPCINAGNNAFAASTTDLDGNPRIVAGAVDMGAYEFPAPIHYANLQNLAPVSPYTNWPTAASNIQDAIDVATAGEVIVVSNGVYQTGGRAVYGLMTNRVVIDKAVTVQSVNGPQFTLIQGYQVPGITNEIGAIRCVYLTNGAALLGFTLTNGATRGHTGGDNVNERSAGAVWCESTNITISNCALINNSAYAYGGGAYRGSLTCCTLIGNSAGNSGGGAYNSTLNNCTLAGNSAYFDGGGAYSNLLNNCVLTANQAGSSSGHGGGAAYSSMSNCVLVGNSAWAGGGAYVHYLGSLNGCTLSNNSASYGGGVECYLVFGTLNNCTLRNNKASADGGAAYKGKLNNCMLIGNSAGRGGAAWNGTLNNCTLVSNTNGAHYSTLNNCIACLNTGDLSASLNYCCTMPDPGGAGNITNEPAFVDLAGGDFHLQSNSPCINSGNNAYVALTDDLDGNPRISKGTVDIGAYEFQNPASVISYAWLLQYGLATDGSADYADSDIPAGDGVNNWQEWMADTSPLDGNDFLQVTNFTRSGTYNTLWWASKSTRLYEVQRRAGLDVASPWETIITSAEPGWNNVGFDNTGPQYFYRIRAVRP